MLRSSANTLVSIVRVWPQVFGSPEDYGRTHAWVRLVHRARFVRFAPGWMVNSSKELHENGLWRRAWILRPIRHADAAALLG